MGAFKRILNYVNPRTGRILRENGEFVNEADFLAFEQDYTLQRLIVDNKAARLSGRRRNINQETYWIGLDIPSGKKLLMWGDALRLSEGDYDVDVVRAPDGFTGGSLGIKRCMCGGGTQVETDIYFDVTPVDEGNHETILEDYRDVGQIQGLGRPTAAPADDDAFQINMVPVMIKITRVEGGSYALSYRIRVSEEDIQ